MKDSKYKSFEKLPMVLNAKRASGVLGLSISGTYELMRRKEAQLDAGLPSKTYCNRNSVISDFSLF